MTQTKTLFPIEVGKESDHCATPEWIYRYLDMEFAFDLDPCPLTPLADGLNADWTGRRVYCNPPYSNIRPWVEKAVGSKCLTVFLVPARFDAKWCRILREARAEFRHFARDFRFPAADGATTRPVGGYMVVVLNRLYEAEER